MYKTYYESSLGNILLMSEGEKLNFLYLQSGRFYDEKNSILKDNLEIFIKTKKWLDKYFGRENPDISNIELEPVGSSFRKDVWKILCKIPYGELTTYGRIASEVAQKRGLKSMSAQAIGNAVGHNPISIIIPCHRVVGKNGSLIGYGGGIQNKVKLLELECVDMTNLFVPTKGTAL